MHESKSLYKLDMILKEAAYGNTVSKVKDNKKTARKNESVSKIQPVVITKELVERIIKRVERI